VLSVSDDGFSVDAFDDNVDGTFSMTFADSKRLDILAKNGTPRGGPRGCVETSTGVSRDVCQGSIPRPSRNFPSVLLGKLQDALDLRRTGREGE